MKKKVIFAGVIAAVPEPHLSEERTLFCELVVQAAHGIFRVQVKSSMQHLLYALAEPGDAVLCSGHFTGSLRFFSRRKSPEKMPQKNKTASQIFQKSHAYVFCQSEVSIFLSL